jgi:tRNA threonylcarbamoyladenosine biosynthesis protein TsaB
LHVKLLAVDTALGACSSAIFDDDVILGHCFEPMERGHAERLAPMVRDVMRAAGLDFPALDRLAVTVGPGTFTGQRVGYAFMRGLRLALHRPLVGVTTLEAMAEAAMGKTGALSAAVLHDARRGEVYVGAAGRIVIPVQIAALDDAVRMIRAAAAATGDALALAGSAADAAAVPLAEYGIKVVNAGIVSPDALWVARMALSAPEPATVPRPLYLRPPDARLPGAHA